MSDRAVFPVPAGGADGESLFPLRGRPVVLDAFCGAGGTGMGYYRAGFDVLGVDVAPQPNYPFQFVQMDALEYLDGMLSSWTFNDVPLGLCPHGFFAGVHASPPCQTFTAYRRKGHGVGDGYLNLIPETRELIERTGLPYVIENVEQARSELRNPVTLCGSSFALDVRRHRLFETNWPLAAPACRHDEQEAPGKRYAGATNREGRFTCEIGVWRIPLYRQQVAMGGVHWMTLEELSEAVPPAYTEHIGAELFQFLRREEAVVVAA